VVVVVVVGNGGGGGHQWVLASQAHSSSSLLPPHSSSSLLLLLQETDTQAALWRDADNKEVILSFRGTEAIRDFFTDIQIAQEPITPVG